MAYLLEVGGAYGERRCRLTTDQPTAALIKDLRQRGLLDDTLVIWGGEFGRTPRILKVPNAYLTPGRDHWGACQSVVLAGGGIRGGQVYGASDKIAAYPTKNPVKPEDVIATMYHAMGIPPQSLIHDQQNRPHRISEGRPLTELFG